MSTIPHDATCKLCHKPLVVYIDDSYDLSDPFKLIRMACHDRCYDNKTKRDRAIDSIFKVCHNLIERKCTADQISKAKMALRGSTRKLAEAMASHYGSRELLWSEDFADILVSRPSQAGATIAGYRTQCRDKYRTLADPPKTS